MCTSVDLFKKKLIIKNICMYMYIHVYTCIRYIRDYSEISDTFSYFIILGMFHC